MPNRPEKAAANLPKSTGDASVASAYNRQTPAESRDVVDVSQVVAVLLHNARLIVGATLAFALAGSAFVLSRPMLFEAQGKLYLGDVDKKGLAGSFEVADGTPSDITSETEILRSDSIVSAAVLRSGANVEVQLRGARPVRFAAWLMSGRDKSLLDSGTRSIVVRNAAPRDDADGVQRLVLTVRDNEHFLVGGQGDDRTEVAGSFGAPVETPRFHLTVERAPGSRSQPGAQYDIAIHPVDITVRSVERRLQTSSTRIAQSDFARVLAISFDDRSPRLAQDLVEQLMQVYLQERQSWKSAAASATEEFISDRLQSLRDELVNSEGKLTAYRREHSDVLLDSEAKTLVGQLAAFEQQRIAARLQVTALSALKRGLASPTMPLEAYMVGDIEDGVLRERARALAELRSKLTDLEQRYSAESSEVRTQRALVEAEVRIAANYVGARLARANEQLASLSAIVEQYEAKLRGVPGAAAGVAQLARESEVYSKTYTYLLERQQQAGILKVSTLSKNRILDHPRRPYVESKPSLVRGALFGIAGFCLMIGYVIVRRYASTRIQSAAELNLMAGARVIAELPSLRDRKAKKSVEPHEHQWDDSPAVEAFRRLRANLYRLSPLGAPQVVVVSSPEPGDGKTTTVFWLAAALAADGRQVLVIDADLRKPSHAQVLGTPDPKGLRNVLSGSVNWRAAVQPATLHGQEFYSLGAGSFAPAELLSGERMRKLLAEARETYDVVLVDTASFPVTADALVLSRWADCLLTVVRTDHTRRRVAEEYFKRLADAAPLAGTVLNDAANTAIPYYGVYPQPGKA